MWLHQVRLVATDPASGEVVLLAHQHLSGSPTLQVRHEIQSYEIPSPGWVGGQRADWADAAQYLYDYEPWYEDDERGADDDPTDRDEWYEDRRYGPL